MKIVLEKVNAKVCAVVLVILVFVSFVSVAFAQLDSKRTLPSPILSINGSDVDFLIP